MIVASIGHLQMDIWSHAELNYKTGLLHLHQIAGMAGCILTNSDFREPAVYLVTSIWYLAIKVGKLTDFHTRVGGSATKGGSPIKKTTTIHVIKTKKSVMNCAFGLELTQNYCNFWTCEWIFCWNIQWFYHLHWWSIFFFDTDMFDSIQISIRKYRFSI